MLLFSFIFPLELKTQTAKEHQQTWAKCPKSKQSAPSGLRTRKLTSLGKTTHSTITTLISSRHWREKRLVIPSQMIQTKARWELESHSLVVINEAPNTHPPRSVKKKKRSDRDLGPLPCLSVTASLTVLTPGLGILPLPLKISESTAAHCFFKGHFHLSVRRTILGVRKFHLTITRILSQDRHMNY